MTKNAPVITLAGMLAHHRRRGFVKSNFCDIQLIDGSFAALKEAKGLLAEQIGAGKGLFQSGQIRRETFKELLRCSDAAMAHQQQRH